jgi:predicted RNase H-like HicB family nuclease
MDIQTPPYEVILYWSKVDQRVIAEVPELVGCAADGLTYEEAIANVQVVIEEWIETAQFLGRPIPTPKGRLVFA